MSSTEELKFKQVAELEVKQERISHFGTVSDGNFIALLGTVDTVPLLELHHHMDGSDPFPYFFSDVPIPSERPISAFLKQMDLQSLYARTTMLESQALSMDPVLIADCLKSVPKIKLAQLHFALDHHGPEQLLAVVTGYGACLVIAKETAKSLQWNRKVYDLNAMLCDGVYLLDDGYPNEISTFKEVKAALYKFWITAFAWNSVPNKNAGFVANAVGHIIAFNFNVSTEVATLYSRVETSLGHINYLKSFGNLLLASDIDGIVRLFRIDYEGEPSIVETAVLCNRKDRLGCRRAEANFCVELFTYVVAMTKGAHLLIYRITEEGVILCKSCVRLHGIEISGLTSLSEVEFIATTVIGKVWHIHVLPTDSMDMRVKTHMVHTDLDGRNMSLLAVEASRNRSLWMFVRYRNTEYKHGSKFSPTSVILSICTLNKIDVLSRLESPSHRSFDSFIDDMAALRLNILKNHNREIYKKFLDLTLLNFPKQFEDNYLQQLQLALLIARNNQKYEIHKLRATMANTQDEIEYLHRAVHLVHLLCRLKFLRSLGARLSPFQRLARRCMRSKCLLLNAELENRNLPFVQTMHDNILRFKSYISQMYLSVYKEQNDGGASESCSICDAPIDNTTQMCAQNHQSQRCCISAVQLPFVPSETDDMNDFPNPFKPLTRHCPQCHSLALIDNDDLKQLLASDDPVMCSFCRLYFIES